MATSLTCENELPVIHRSVVSVLCCRKGTLMRDRHSCARAQSRGYVGADWPSAPTRLSPIFPPEPGLFPLSVIRIMTRGVSQ